MVGSNSTLIIGIAGGSGAGKSSLCKTLFNLLTKKGWQVQVICHDNYYKDISHLTLEERSKNNFDHPDSLDTELLVNHLKELKRGRSVRIPTYDFTTHSRTDVTVQINPAKVIIVEGILILENEPLRKTLDLSMFVESRSDTRLSRRIKRDVRERGRTMESVLSQFRNTVQPMYEQFVDKGKLLSDFIISGEKWPTQKFLDFLLRGICIIEEEQSVKLVKAPNPMHGSALDAAMAALAALPPIVKTPKHLVKGVARVSSGSVKKNSKRGSWV